MRASPRCNSPWRPLEVIRAAFAALLAASTVAAAQPLEDPFAHLEDAADARTQEAIRAQGQRAREALDRIPGRAELLARVRVLSRAAPLVTHIALGGNRVFILRAQAAPGGAALFVREGIDGADRLLFDAGREAGPGAVIPSIFPSPDGRHVALGLAAAGEAAVLRVVAVDGARFLPERVDGVRFNEGIAWHPDSRAFYYARSNMRMYRHMLGRAADRDEVVFAPGVGGARDVPQLSYPSLLLPQDSKFAYAIVRDGFRREVAVHVTSQSDLAAARPAWRKLVAHEDDVIAVDAARDELFLLTHRQAPRHRVLRMKAGAALATARQIVPQGDAVIEQIGIARDALYLRTMVGGVDRLERVPIGLLGAKAPEFLRLPFDHAVSQLVTDPRHAGALLRLQGWIEPPVVAQLDARTGDLRRTNMQPPVGLDFSAMDEVRLYAPAADGTRIPITLVYRKNTRLTGENAMLLEAYGSYGRTLSAFFEPARLAWLERGGVLAFAHARGGGEYGTPWHQAARGVTKTTTVTDLVSCAEFLIAYGFTNPGRLALSGEGAGGVAIGAAMARRPELFAAMVARAPLLDLLRHERGSEGRGGSAEWPRETEALRALSPYHQLREGVAYPATLLDVSEGGGADSWHAAKFVARLQQLGGRAALLRTGPRDRIEMLADHYAFAWSQMAEPGFAPRAPEPPPAPATAPPPERGDD